MGELIKGVSDLPVSLLALVLGYLLRERGQNRWALVFFLAGIGAAMGAFVHAVPLELKVFRTVWLMLYSLLYGTVLLFRLRVLNEPPKGYLYILGALLWLVTVILLLRGSGWDIYVFALFAAVVLIPVFFRIFAQPDASPYLKRMLIAAAPALAFQALKAVIPYGVVLGHVCLMVALIFAYCVAAQESDTY